MQQIIGAAAQFPTVIFTSALVVVLGFWFLVLLGRARARDFDADAPALTEVFGGLPVAVAAFVVTVCGWLVSLTGLVVLERTDVTGFGAAAARVALLALSTFVAWSVTHGLAAPLSRQFSGERRPSQGDLADATPFDPGSPSARS
ncbi:hypothetical protein ABZ137_35485 [Streptomyces bobili]|uniref:hypothetical protein n=1 Tax=Streptomyces bobili TaxID=67280 RepID=UPI0033A78AD1